MTTLGDRIAAAKRHPADLTYSEWVELLEDVERKLPTERLLADACYVARLARGSSWPGEMAESVERAAERVVAWAVGEPS